MMLSAVVCVSLSVSSPLLVRAFDDDVRERTRS